MYLQLVLRSPECLLHWLLAAIFFLGCGKKKKERTSCRRNVTNLKQGTLNFYRVMRAAISIMHNIGSINTHTYNFVQQTVRYPFVPLILCNVDICVACDNIIHKKKTLKNNNKGPIQRLNTWFYNKYTSIKTDHLYLVQRHMDCSDYSGS